MGKIAGKRGRSGGGENTAKWSATDHIIRKAKQEIKMNDKQEERARRSAFLTRGSKEKKEEGKLRLHIKRIQKQMDNLRERLERWDDVEENRLAKLAIKEEEKRKEDELNPPVKKKGRKGPETWKLKGAARPAWQVYDFDTRYVCPHIKAHEDHKIKTKRLRNIFSIFKGRFGEEADEIPQPHCRAFLSLLMQLGNLAMRANQQKTSRKAFLECMELDSEENPVTPARCQLMRLYVDANHPGSARRLWEKLPPNDPAVWIRYSAALIEFVSWTHLQEEGSSQESAELLLSRAIRANVFCAYYLAFHDTFNDVMDYVEEIEDADEGRPLEEAIEYCNSEQMGAWQGTEGAVEWVRDVVLKAIHSHSDEDGELELSPSDLEWRGKLAKLKEEYEANAKEAETSDETNDDEDGAIGEEEAENSDEINEDEDEDDDEANGETEESNDSDEEDESVVNVAMYAGMFETGMEMLEEAGKLKRKKQTKE
jgi:hypothetical protein